MKKLLCLLNINIENINYNKLYNLWVLIIKELINNTIITIDESKLLLSIHNNDKIISYIQYMKSYISSNYELFFYNRPDNYYKGIHYLNIPKYSETNKQKILINLMNYIKLFKIKISNIHLYRQYIHILQENENKILLHLLNSLKKCCNNNKRNMNNIILLLIKNTQDTPYKKLTHEGKLWANALSKDMVNRTKEKKSKSKKSKSKKSKSKKSTRSTRSTRSKKRKKKRPLNIKLKCKLNKDNNKVLCDKI